MKEVVQNLWCNLRIPIVIVILYSFSCMYYLSYLNSLNAELLNLKNVWEIMSYREGLAWYYLLEAILLVFVGLLITYILWRYRRVNSFIDLILLIMMFLIVVLFVVMIIININNPILRAALSVVFIGGLFTMVLSTN